MTADPRPGVTGHHGRMNPAQFEDALAQFEAVANTLGRRQAKGRLDSDARLADMFDRLCTEYDQLWSAVTS